MKVKYSSKEMNEIFVDIEHDADISYLWKWGTYEELSNGDYAITPPLNNPRITFQTALRNLVRISNETNN